VKRRAPRRRTLFRSRGNEEEEPARSLRVGPFDVSDMTLGVTQMWEVGPRVRVAPGKRARRACDIGFGAVYVANASEVQPCARVRCRVPHWLPYAPDAVLRLLPNPEAVLKGSWPLPGTGLRVAARLTLPWGNEQFDALALGEAIPWRPHFSCKLSTSADRGPLQFSPRGLELAEQRVALGRDTVLRVAATGAQRQQHAGRTCAQKRCLHALHVCALRSRLSSRMAAARGRVANQSEGGEAGGEDALALRQAGDVIGD
jgi:hypothetical protein